MITCSRSDAGNAMDLILIRIEKRKLANFAAT